MSTLNDRAPGPDEMEIIRDMMTKRDILNNMAFAEQRRRKAALTQQLIQPRPKSLSPGLRIALGIAEGVILLWVLYGVSVFVRKAFESATMIF